MRIMSVVVLLEWNLHKSGKKIKIGWKQIYFTSYFKSSFLLMSVVTRLLGFMCKVREPFGTLQASYCINGISVSWATYTTRFGFFGGWLQNFQCDQQHQAKAHTGRKKQIGVHHYNMLSNLFCCRCYDHAGFYRIEWNHYGHEGTTTNSKAMNTRKNYVPLCSWVKTRKNCYPTSPLRTVGNIPVLFAIHQAPPLHGCSTRSNKTRFRKTIQVHIPSSLLPFFIIASATTTTTTK